jgi:transposase InsO family protein
MLQELAMVEQRYLAVREVLDSGAAITDIATRYGVNRRTLHRWLLRYAAGGLGALADRSSRPDTCPHQIDAAVEARIVALRRAHPGWGPRTILNRLRRELEIVPSRSAIYRALVRHSLIEPKPRRRRRQDYRRWERSRAMELWQMDVMGGVLLDDGTKVSVVTGVDDHSRFCVCAVVVARPTARPVCDALVGALRRHGIPDQILTDNGKVFTGKLAAKPATVLFDRICHDNGIRHILTAPYSPTTTGKIERLHKTMRKEFFADQRFATLEEAQRALDAWVSDYNTNREHQGIGDVAPIRRFELAQPASFEVLDGDIDVPPEAEPARFVTRRVDDKGRISILNHRYHVGCYLAGQSVKVESHDGLLNVSHNGVVVATHARRHLPELDDHLDRRSKAARPARPTKGDEVFRGVDPKGSVSFAGTSYRVGNAYRGMLAGVRLVGDTVQITIDGQLVRTHRARHDKSKEFGALAQPNGKPRRSSGVA